MSVCGLHVLFLLILLLATAVARQEMLVADAVVSQIIHETRRNRSIPGPQSAPQASF